MEPSQSNYRTIQVLINLLIFFSFLEFSLCYGLTVNFTGDEGRTELSSLQRSDKSDRHSKQIYLPVVLWSHPLRFVAANSYSTNGQQYYYPHLQHFLPLYYQPSQSHQPKPIKSSSPSPESVISNPSVGDYSTSTATEYRKEHIQYLYQKIFLENLSQVHRHKNVVQSADVLCNNHGTKGTCKSFSQCFPMLEMEYGSDDYMDTPLAEQLVMNTNVSTCSKMKHATAKSTHNICCPKASFKRIPVLENRNLIEDYFSDSSVNLPAITQRPPHRLTLSRQLIDKKMCGQSKVLGSPRNSKALTHKGDLKITGGHEAKGPAEFPWMVGVFGKNKKLFCGASLISEQFVISAGHCFSTFSASDVPHLYVHIGDFNIKSTSDGPHQVRRIGKIIIHKNFNIANYHNDIALLKLDRPVNFTDRIQPICLPEPTMNSLENRKLIVTGWGRKYRYGGLTDVLRKVEIPVWDHNECKRIYSTFAPGRLQDSNLCAGDGKRNKDACIGDSGGPAISFDGEKWAIQGIVSWGKGCGSFPGVYTRVDRHLMWLTSNLNKNS